MNSLKPVKAKYRLGRVTNKYLILDIIFFSFFRQRGFNYLHQSSKSLRQLLKENLKAALSQSEDALNHLKDLPYTVSQINLPESYQQVWFVYLSEDRLYTAADETLYVYSMSDHTSPIATYQLGGGCYSGIMSDNYLYLGGWKLHVFEVTTSLTQPLVPVKVINTDDQVKKILRVDSELILGESYGYL